MRHLLCEVLASEMKVYQYSMMQAVFSIHDKCKKCKQALLSYTTVCHQKKRKQTIEWKPPLNTAVGFIKTAGHMPSLKTIQSPCLLSVVHVGWWIETDVVKVFLSSLLTVARGIPRKVKNDYISPFQLTKLYFHHWRYLYLAHDYTV